MVLRGGEAQRLSDSTRYEAFAALAGDHQGMLYVSNRDGNGSVWWQRDGAEHRLPLPAAEAWVRPQWLDADHVLLTRYVSGGAASIEVFQLSTQRLIEHHPLSGPGFAGMALDRQRILLGLGHGDSSGMQLLIRDGIGDHPLAAGSLVEDFATDGEHIGWTRRGDAQLYWIKADGLSAEPSRLPLPVEATAWTLHEGQLVYAASDVSGWALWRQDLAGGESRRWLAVRGAPTDGRIALSPDGGQVVLSHIDDFSSDLMRVPAPPP